jgi:hypothetical protein
MPGKDITRVEYNAEKIAVKAISLLFIFIHLPTPGFVRRNGWEGHSPAIQIELYIISYI